MNKRVFWAKDLNELGKLEIFDHETLFLVTRGPGTRLYCFMCRPCGKEKHFSDSEIAVYYSDDYSLPPGFERVFSILVESGKLSFSAAGFRPMSDHRARVLFPVTYDFIKKVEIHESKTAVPPIHDAW